MPCRESWCISPLERDVRDVQGRLRDALTNVDALDFSFRVILRGKVGAMRGGVESMG